MYGAPDIEFCMILPRANSAISRLPQDIGEFKPTYSHTLQNECIKLRKLDFIIAFTAEIIKYFLEKPPQFYFHGLILKS